MKPKRNYVNVIRKENIIHDNMDGEAKEKVCITTKKRMKIIRKNKKESRNKTFDKVENYSKDLMVFSLIIFAIFDIIENF